MPGPQGNPNPHGHGCRHDKPLTPEALAEGLHDLAMTQASTTLEECRKYYEDRLKDLRSKHESALKLIKESQDLLNKARAAIEQSSAIADADKAFITELAKLHRSAHSAAPQDAAPPASGHDVTQPADLPGPATGGPDVTQPTDVPGPAAGGRNVARPAGGHGLAQLFSGQAPTQPVAAGYPMPAPLWMRPDQFSTLRGLHGHRTSEYRPSPIPDHPNFSDFRTLLSREYAEAYANPPGWFDVSDTPRGTAATDTEPQTQQDKKSEQEDKVSLAPTPSPPNPNPSPHQLTLHPQGQNN